MNEIDRFADVLSEQQRRQWPHAARIAKQLGGCLMGGTAVAVHLRHRRSADFDIMTLRPFSGVGVHKSVCRFAGTIRLREATRNCFHAEVDGIEWDVFRALRSQEVEPEQMRTVAEGPSVAGMPVGSLPDLLATKLDVIQYRLKLRDYIDIAAIDAMTPHRIEDGLRYYCQRFGYRHVPRALDWSLNLLADPGAVPPDEELDDQREEVFAYLSRRAFDAVRHLAQMRQQTQRASSALSAAPIRRCGEMMPRAMRPCILPHGHSGHHRSR